MFTESLKVRLDLSTKGHQHRVQGHLVTRCAFELRVHGFEASVTFGNTVGGKDELIDWFGTEELMEARITVEPVMPRQAIEPLVLVGVVTDKGLVETSAPGVKGDPVLLRQYSIRCADLAAVLWRQHFPLELYADAKMADVIAAHLPGGMKLECSLNAASEPMPLVCLGLGESSVSFYDFVLWYAHRTGGCFYYDHRARQYHLAAKRPVENKGSELRAADTGALRVHHPATIRHAARVLNAHTTSDGPLAVQQSYAVAGISRDRLIRTAIKADVDAAKRREAERLATARPELHIEYRAFPTVALHPGARVSLCKDDFSAALALAAKPFRICEVSFSAEAAPVDPGGPRYEGAGVYRVALATRWESEDDRRERLPAHSSPTWPIFVEGEIICEVGAARDRTFEAQNDRATGLSHYRVHVPLWNQNIHVPFQPQFLPGHFYAPAFKDSRVLLALYFDHAEIAQFLDWGPEVQLPADSQGNHLLFGKNKTSQTSLKHAYVDDKPVFCVRRVADGDVGRLQMEEGTLVLEVRQDATAHGGGDARVAPKIAPADPPVAPSPHAATAEVPTTPGDQSSGESAPSTDDDKRAPASAPLADRDGSLAGAARLQTLAAPLDEQDAALRSRAQAATVTLAARRG